MSENSQDYAQKPQRNCTQCCGSGMFIPDPNFIIPDTGSEIYIKEFKYFKPKKWFLSSRKYDTGCSSPIRIPDLYPDFLPIPDNGSRIQGSKRHRLPDPQHWSYFHEFGFRNHTSLWTNYHKILNSYVGSCTYIHWLLMYVVDQGRLCLCDIIPYHTWK